MRENWDFVSMENYTADMKESADQAVSVIEAVERRRRDSERGLIAAVIAAGGKLTIQGNQLIHAARATLRIERNEAMATATSVRTLQWRTAFQLPCRTAIASSGY